MPALIFAGGSNRGWASRGSKPFTFERVKWTGKTPFEIQTMTANKDGFTLNFHRARRSRHRRRSRQLHHGRLDLHLPGGIRQPGSRSIHPKNHRRHRLRRQKIRPPHDRRPRPRPRPPPRMPKASNPPPANPSGTRTPTTPSTKSRSEVHEALIPVVFIRRNDLNLAAQSE